MGKILKYSDRVVFRFEVDDVLAYRVATSKDVTFTLSTMIGRFAEMKGQERKLALPKGAVIIAFDKNTSEFVVTFAERPEQVLTIDR